MKMELYEKVFRLKIVEGTTVARLNHKKPTSVRRLSFFVLWKRLFHEKEHENLKSNLNLDNVPAPSETCSVETKLIRFLVHGRQNQNVADVLDLGTLTEEELISFRLLLSKVNIPNLKRAFFVLDMRELTHLSPLQKTIPFVLAEMTKRSVTLLPDEVTRDLLKEAQDFILFVKFFVETDPFVVHEQFQNFITEWYSKKDAFTLVRMICEKPMHLGYSHGEAMKYGDFESAPLHVKVVREYAVNGLEAASSIFGEKPEASLILECFEGVEKMRTTSDPQTALKQIMFEDQSYANTNAAILKDKNVMKVLLKKIGLHELTLLLPTMIEEKFFQNGDGEYDPLFVRRVQDRLVDYSSIESCRIQPSESFVIRQNLIDSKTLSVPKEILDALSSQMEKSFMNVTSIDLELTVILDCNRLGALPCVGGNVSAQEAAAVLALTMKKAGRNVKILTFDGLKRLELNEPDVSSLSSAISSRAHLDSSNSAKDFAARSSGALIIIGHSPDVSAFCEIANEKKFKSKVVLCDLCGSEFEKVDHDDVLVTVGFNENTSDIILSFLVISQIL